MKQLKELLIESLSTPKVFILVKPGSLSHTQDIIQMFEERGWNVTATVVKLLQPKEAKQLYYVHRKEDFYNDLCEYMTTDLCRAFIIEKAESKNPFDEVKAIKDEVREKWGESDMRNVLHSSDSIENMEREASLFFQTW